MESHSYEIENVDEMVALCVEAFDLSREDVLRYMAEAREEPEFTTLLRRRTRFAFDLKTQPGLGQRLLWWVLVRGRKPGLIVETGIHDGLGSLVLLVAAERNAAEGGPDAHVIGVDSNPFAGRLVPDRVKGRWEHVVGYSTDVLEDVVAGRRIGVFVHDTDHTEALQSFEFGLALAHASDPLTIVDSSGGDVPTLARLAGLHGARVYHAVPVADRTPGRKRVDFATFRGGPEALNAPESRPSS